DTEPDEGLAFVIQCGAVRCEVFPPRRETRGQGTAFAVRAQARVQREHLVFRHGPEAQKLAHQTFKKLAVAQRFGTRSFAGVAVTLRAAIHEYDLEVGTGSQLVAAEFSEGQQDVGTGGAVLRDKPGLQGVEREREAGLGEAREALRERASV